MSFSFIFRPIKQTVHFFYNKSMWKFHLVYGAGIQTHNLSNMSHLP